MSEKTDKGKDEPRQEDSQKEKKPRPEHVPDRHYIKVDTRLLRYWLPAIGSDAVMVYEIILDCFNDKLGYAYPSLAQIQGATGFGKKTILKAIERLEAVKLVKIRSGGGRGRANQYIPLPPAVTEDTVKLIKESGRKVIMDHLHLFSDSDELSVLNDTDTETNEKAKLGPKDTSTNTKEELNWGQKTPVSEQGADKQGSNDPSLEETGAKRHQGVGPKDTSTKIYNEDLKEEQQQKGINLASLPHKQENGHSEDVAVFSGENSEIGELVEALCQFENVEEPEARSIIRKLVEEYGVDTVRGQVGSALAQREKVKNPIGWLRTACSEGYKIVNSDQPKERTEADEVVDYLKKCVDSPSMVGQTYLALVDLAKKTGKAIEEVYTENTFLPLTLAQYKAETELTDAKDAEGGA